MHTLRTAVEFINSPLASKHVGKTCCIGFDGNAAVGKLMSVQAFKVHIICMKMFVGTTSKCVRFVHDTVIR
jgi:hypothetical protein